MDMASVSHDLPFTGTAEKWLACVDLSDWLQDGLGGHTHASTNQAVLPAPLGQTTTPSITQIHHSHLPVISI